MTPGQWLLEIWIIVLPILAITFLWIFYAIRLFIRNRKLIQKEKQENLNELAKIFYDFSFDFHDSVGGPIKIIRKELDENMEKSKNGTPDVDSFHSLEKVSQKLAQITQSIKEVESKIFPFELVGNHLYDGIEKMLRSLATENLILDVQICSTRNELQEYVSLNVFQTVQELINNIRIHTETNFLEFFLVEEKNQIQIRITYRNMIQPKNEEVSPRGLGKLSLEKRIKFLNAKFSRKDLGDYIEESLEIPLKLVLD